MCNVVITRGTLPQDAVDRFIQRAAMEYGMRPSSLRIAVDDGYVDIVYVLDGLPFSPVRRIEKWPQILKTGNSGKRSA